MSATVGFAVVGAGLMGRLRAATIRRHREAALVAVADVESDRAEALARGDAAAVDDHRRALELDAVDVVVVSTPVQHHATVVADALAAGRHVLCEKPLSSTAASCRRLVEAAREAGRTLSVGFNHRYYPSIATLKRAIDEGRIGELDHLRLFGGHEGLAQFRADWNYQSAFSGGGAMMDLGIHLTDLARYLGGEIVEVYGVASNRVWRVDGSEDNALVIMRCASGAAVTYQTTWTEWRGYRLWVEAYGDRGMARAQYAPTVTLLVTQAKPGAARRRSLRLHPLVNLREKLFGWRTTARTACAAELDDLLRRLDGEEVPLADGVDGLRAVEIAEAVYESSAERRPVRLASSDD